MESAAISRRAQQSGTLDPIHRDARQPRKQEQVDDERPKCDWKSSETA